jgi:hypothetical protein
MIKSIEEVTIYESPDGGKTIYARKSGSVDREMIYQDHCIHYIARWYEWKEILRAAEDNVTLNDLIKRVEEVYALVKEKP